MDGISANDSSALKNSASGLAAPHYIAAENSPRLLLVDDEPRLLSSLCAMLGDRGFQMLTTSSGSETIELLGKLQPQGVELLLDQRPRDHGLHQCQRH